SPARARAAGVSVVAFRTERLSFRSIAVSIRSTFRSATSRFLPFAIFAVLVATHTSTAGGQGRGAQAPAGPQQGRGGRGAAPVGQLNRGGGPQTPDGALAPGAPHPAALPIDVFTTKNFYKDVALWSDPKYFRCNISR